MMTSLRRRLLAGTALFALSLAVTGQAGAQTFTPRAHQAPAAPAPTLAAPSGTRPGLVVEALPRRAPEGAPALLAWHQDGAVIEPWAHADRGIRAWGDNVAYRLSGQVGVTAAGPYRLAITGEGWQEADCQVRLTLAGIPVLEGLLRSLPDAGRNLDHRPSRLLGESRQVEVGWHELAGTIACATDNAAGNLEGARTLPRLTLEAVRPGETEASPLQASELVVTEALAARAARPAAPAPTASGAAGWTLTARPIQYRDLWNWTVAGDEWAAIWRRRAFPAGQAPAAGWSLRGDPATAGQLRTALSTTGGGTGDAAWEAAGTLTVRERGPHWIALPLVLGDDASASCRAELRIDDQPTTNLVEAGNVMAERRGRTRLLHAALVTLEPGDYALTARVACASQIGTLTEPRYRIGVGVLIRTPTDPAVRLLRPGEVVARPMPGRS